MNTRNQEPVKINWDAVESVEDVVSVLRQFDIRISPDHELYRVFKDRGLLDIEPKSDNLSYSDAMELAKCYADPVYFAENYYTIYNYAGGFQKPVLSDWQKRFIRDVARESSFICDIKNRQEGKTLALSIATLWVLIFGTDECVGYITTNSTHSHHLVVPNLLTAIRALPYYFGGESFEVSKEKIHAKNSNVYVYFLSSCSNHDGLPGISWTRFFMDEFRYFDNNFEYYYSKLLNSSPNSPLKQMAKVTS